MTNAISRVAHSVKNWWVLLIMGILMIIGAIWMFKTPIGSFAGIVFFFSILILISGVLSVFFAFSNKDDLDNWGLYLVGGILDVVVGVILLKHPAKAIVIFSVFIGLWLLFRGVSSISASFKLKKDGVENWGWVLVIGIFTTIFALMAVLYQPLLGGAYLAYMLAFAFLFLGIVYIFISLQLKKVKTRVVDVKGRIVDDFEEIKEEQKD
ncbi:MAG: HdeD family acid-resistance protein [Flavobacteriaceae bacterium]|nr:HdeD family acid-resistance protein [Flavobacteriaceae bacterium]